MWCLTGVVLVFVGFPHSSTQERFEHLEFFTESDFEHLSYFEGLNSGDVELEKYLGKPVYRAYKSRKSQIVYNAQTLEECSPFAKEDAIKEAEGFLNATVREIDSVPELDSWIPWGHYKPLLPFYKCYMNDDAHTVLYISAKSGTIIQQTERFSRWMARIGAIPHMFYFYQIKQDSAVWENTILVLGIIGLLVTLSGLIVALYRFKRNTSGKVTGITVYKKWSYKWHHIFGLFIGLFFCTFLLSGIFYATDVPEWLVSKPEGKSPMSQWNKGIKVDSVMHPSSVWNAIPNKNGIRKIAWSSSLGQPCIEVFYNEAKIPEVLVYFGSDSLERLDIDESDVEKYAQKLFKDTFISLETQEHYNEQYLESGMFNRPLPVYKITIDDGFNTVLFVDPSSGKAVTYFNSHKEAALFLTRGLHKFNFSVFENADWLRMTILIIITLLCGIVSLTGVILSWKWLKRVAMKAIR